MGLIQTLSLCVSLSLFLTLPTVVELLLLLKIKRLVDYFFFFWCIHTTYCSLTPLFFHLSLLLCFVIYIYISYNIVEI